MTITVNRESLFRSSFSIKYITSWDNNFDPNHYTGFLSFYRGDPLYLLDIFIDCSDKTKLKEEDIVVTLGEYHNASNIEDMIHKNTNLIYEVCKSSPRNKFVLDLAKMKMLEPDDFNDMLPTHGLHTFFVFENLHNRIFCLVNPTKDVNSKQIFSWLVSYIYSSVVCLAPRNKIENYAKQFMQAISTLSASKGKIKSVYVATNDSVLNSGMSNMGEYVIPVPGDKTERFEKLVTQAMEQMTKKTKKESK